MLAQNSGTLELWNFKRKTNFKLLAWNLELGTLVLGKSKYFSNVGPEPWNSGTLELLKKIYFQSIGLEPGTWNSVTW